jgi:Asparagine synthase
VDYRELLFKLGYLLTTEDIRAVDDPAVDAVAGRWVVEQVGPFSLYRDPDLALQRYGEKGSSVVLLGLAVDPVTPTGDPRQIVRDLFLRYARSEEEFYEKLDDLSGRFVVITQAGGSCSVFQDASGLKTAYYDVGGSGPSVSSHASLLARLRGYATSREAREFIASKDYGRTVTYFPGNATPFEQVMMLTPNTLLDVPETRVRRFSPREPLGSRPLEAYLVEELAVLLRRQMELLAERYPLAVSLTGGIDSRVTAAATRGCGKGVHYWTWMQFEEHRREAAIARQVCDLLGGTHTLYPVEERCCGEDLEEYMEVWALNGSGMRLREQGLISKVMLDRYPRGFLHVKSTVSEIGRAFYRRIARRFLPRSISEGALARCYDINRESPLVLDEFSRYIETVGFRREAIYDYDFYDLFYWEHRSGAWQSLAVMDFDSSCDTTVLYNCRRWLTKVLALPLEVRINDRHLRAILLELWPEALEVPLLSDSKKWYVRATKENARRLKHGAEAALDRGRRKRFERGENHRPSVRRG